MGCFVLFFLFCGGFSGCFSSFIVLVTLIVLGEEKTHEVGWAGNGRNLGGVERGERI